MTSLFVLAGVFVVVGASVPFMGAYYLQVTIDVLINLILWTDFKAAAASDRIEDTVDYAALKKRVISLAEASEYHLAETLADRIASLCLEQAAVQQVKVTLEKPTALRFAHSVGVEIIRSRS